MTKQKAIAELVNLGWSDPVPDGKFRIYITSPAGTRELVDPRDLLAELTATALAYSLAALHNKIEISRQYTIKPTGESSSRYGDCEVCYGHCSEVFMMVGHGGGKPILHTFGHKKCLEMVHPQSSAAEEAL